MTLTLRKSSVSPAGRPFALQRPCFCTWKDDICERPGFKFTNSIWRPYSTLRRREAIVRSFYGLQKGYSLWQLKPKKGTLRKQLTVNSLPSNLLKKPFFYLHLIDELIYWLKHFDSRNTYLWHPWQVLRVTGYGFNWEPCNCMCSLPIYVITYISNGRLHEFALENLRAALPSLT